MCNPQEQLLNIARLTTKFYNNNYKLQGQPQEQQQQIKVSIFLPLSP